MYLTTGLKKNLSLILILWKPQTGVTKCFFRNRNENINSKFQIPMEKKKQQTQFNTCLPLNTSILVWQKTSGANKIL